MINSLLNPALMERSSPVLAKFGAETARERHRLWICRGYTPSTGTNYYRLKQMDFDGTYEYSKVVAGGNERER